MGTALHRRSLVSMLTIGAVVPLMFFGTCTAFADPCDPLTGFCAPDPSGYYVGDGDGHMPIPIVIEDEGIQAALPPEQVPPLFGPEVSWENCELLLHMTHYMCGSGPAQHTPPH